MPDPIALDLNLSTAAQVGSAGLSRQDFEALIPAARAAHRSLCEGRKAGKIAFMDLPFDSRAAEAAQSLGGELSAFENLVVLGIGGSSLGAKALFSALCHPFHNLLPRERRSGARLFFPDNSDPSTFSALLDALDLRTTAFAAITKSGGTAETWAQLMVARERLSRLSAEAARRQIVAVTDPEKGALRKVAAAEGWRTLPVPPPVGGRFSVLTAVGLLPAAAAGIDVGALLAGAGEMARRCDSSELFENPAYLFAAALYLFDTSRMRRTHVFMPYADGLRETADWFVQLWAESLGKQGPAGPVGPTPVRAVGATDQHSLLQLLMEGPEDKVAVFVSLDRPREDLEVPKGWTSEPDAAYLGGHTFHELLSAEQRATAAALAAKGRPSLTLRLPCLDARSMGQLMMLLEVATAFAGPLYGVNPYDQPGVEAGKRYACGLLGRPGYERARAELEGRPPPSRDWVL
ncbi:MAG: glucose-6-phosphate isomerase [Myxococcales bacterium]|nr:glucose-6-phosphate isomerase [Myxococcales bacterium]